MSEINLGQVVGPRGFQGIQGIKGDKGDQGIQGVVGPKVDVAASLGTSTVYAVSQKLLTDEVDKMTSSIATIKSQSDASIVKIDNADTKIDTKTSELQSSIAAILSINKKLTNRINALEKSNIYEMFNSSDGIWLDPSDLKTMYQDSSGYTPVTKDGDPVGLILDKSQGLLRGSELTTNGSFTTDSGWSKSAAGVTWTEDKFYRIEDIGGTDSSISQQLVGTVKNRLYEIKIEIGNNTTYIGGAGFRVRVGTSGSVASYGDYIRNVSANQETKFFILAGGDDFYITPHVSTANTYVEIKSISVKEVKGNHALQPLAASRPVYRTDGVLHWLEFDGVDDYLNVNVPLIPQPFTKILGFKTAIAGGYLMNSSSNGRIYMVSGSSALNISAGVLKTASYASGTKTVLKTVFSGSNSSVQFDNKVESLTDLGSNSLGAYTLGSAGVSGQAARLDMYGLILLSNAIADDENIIKEVISKKSGVIL